jgi:hypothetical protein
MSEFWFFIRGFHYRKNTYFHHCFFKRRNKIGAAFGINDAFIAAQIAYQKFLREVAR